MNEVLQTINPYQTTKAVSDTETQTLLNEWFYDREINQTEEDVEKWVRQFKRNLDHVYEHYLLMAELELTKLPEFSEYEHAIHYELNGTLVRTGSRNGTDTHGGSVTEKTSHGGTETLKRTGTDTDQGTNGNTRTFNDTDATTRGGSRTTSNSGTQTTTQTTDATHAEVALAAPQSASYGATGGAMPALNWQYVSSQAQSKDNAGASQRSDNLQETMQDNTSESKKHTGTVADAGTSSNTKTLNLQDMLTRGGEDTTTSTDTRSITYNSTTDQNDTRKDHSDQMETGRNVVETEIRKKIWDYIAHSFALEWLLKEMDVCFLGVF